MLCSRRRHYIPLWVVQLYTPSRAMDATRPSCEYPPRFARKANEDGEVNTVYAHREGSSVFGIAKPRDKRVPRVAECQWEDRREFGLSFLRSMRTNHASITERARRKKPPVPRFGAYSHLWTTDLRARVICDH
jgi:hypothetical protein